MSESIGPQQPLSLREQWQNHKKAREQLLDNAIRTVDSWIGGISDDDLGQVGEEFLDFLRKTGCQQRIDIYYNGAAHYVSFSYAHATGFANEMIYGPAAEEDLSKLFASKVHEATHAMQKMRSAALHASPFNPNTQIVICPRDWLLLDERCEQDAYVKQAFFNSLLAKELPEVRRMSDADALSVKTFERIRLEAPSIQEALIQSARVALSKSYYWDNPKSDYTFQRNYHDTAMKNYKAGIELRKSKGEHDLVYVRLEEEDIHAIGQSFGPNPFGENALLPEFAVAPALGNDAQKTHAEILKTTGIKDEDELPTLSEILQRLGLTRRKFIEASYNRPLNIQTPYIGPN